MIEPQTTEFRSPCTSWVAQRPNRTSQESSMFEFAFTLKPDMTSDHIVALTRQAEAACFNYGWIFDSHVLWQEPYPLLTLMAANTRKMRFGTCVTNPVVRDGTVTASLLATLNRS